MSDASAMNGVAAGDQVADPPKWAATIDLVVKQSINNVRTWVDIEKEKIPIALGDLGSKVESKKTPITFYINNLIGNRNKIRIFETAGVVYDEILKVPSLEGYDGVKIHKSDDPHIRIRCPYGPIFHEKQQPYSKLFTTDLSSLPEKDRASIASFRHLCEDPLIKKHLTCPWSGDLTKNTEIRFEDIWKVYAPGSYVKVRTLKDQNSIRKIIGVNLNYNGPVDRTYIVSCISLIWGGRSFRETRSCLKINSYAGTRKLDSFRGQPISDPKNDSNEALSWVRNGLRYCRYWTSSEVAVKEYEGVALQIPDGYKSDSDSEEETRRIEVVSVR